MNAQATGARALRAVFGATAVMMAVVAVTLWLAVTGGPHWAGPATESGYDPPQTMVLVSGDGMTLRVGYIACVKYSALQTIQRPDSVLLRMYWSGPGECAPPGDSVAMAALTFNYQVHLASPLGGRRLVGPSGEALPRLDQAAMLAFSVPLPQRQHLNPPIASPLSFFPMPGWEFLVPGARCIKSQDLFPQGLQSPGGRGRSMLEQCAYAGTRAVTPPAGTPVTVRGRVGHLLEGGRHAAPALVRYGDPWRAVWWTQNASIVILVSDSTLPGDPSPLPAARLVALANSLSCQQPATCR